MVKLMKILIFHKNRPSRSIIYITYSALDITLITNQTLKPNLDLLFHKTTAPVHLSTVHKDCHGA